MSPVRRVAVVVPARDEEEVLDGCLEALAVARGALVLAHPAVQVSVVVVLDRCLDRSGAVVGRHPVHPLVVDAGCVGLARAAGATHALSAPAAGPGVPSESLWLASTDADSVVPPHWLVAQVDLADAGHDLVLGTVEPVGADEHLIARWARRHRLGEGHPHVHGANLGVRGSRYLEVGGFAGVTVHEDVRLADAVKGTGASWVATDSIRVRTAGRLHGRVSGGFATYLRELAAEPDPAVLAP